MVGFTLILSSASAIGLCLGVEVLAALAYIAVFTCAQVMLLGQSLWVDYGVFYLGIWLLQRCLLAGGLDVFPLLASLFYDCVFSGFPGLFTVGVVLYFTHIRGMIYAYVQEDISELYFYMLYIIGLYAFEWGLVRMLDIMQTVMQTWWLQGLG